MEVARIVLEGVMQKRLTVWQAPEDRRVAKVLIILFSAFNETTDFWNIQPSVIFHRPALWVQADLESIL